MKVIVAGDYCERYRVADAVAKENYGQLFDSEVCSCIKAADYSIINFEFPIVIGDNKPIEKCGPNLKGSIRSIDAIKFAGFKCATLANNHINDYGPDALMDTKRLLEDGGLDTVGAGNNLDNAKQILYRSIEGRVLAIINCCEHEFSIATHSTPGANPLNPIQQYYSILEAKKKADHVMVIVHGGHEHWQLPSQRMVETYRFFIDCGADAVVNHHQHCYSGTETYKGKPILYGLGNFCFDNKPIRDNDNWNYGCMAEIDFNDHNVCFRLIPIIQCDNRIGVRFAESKVFEKKQAELNAIISDTELLLHNNTEYYKDSISTCYAVLNPFQNRYIQALQRRKLFPVLLNKGWLVGIHNFTICESHRDRLIYFFNHLA